MTLEPAVNTAVHTDFKLNRFNDKAVKQDFHITTEESKMYGWDLV